MASKLFDEYPLEYLISNKEKKSDAYQVMYNTNVYLLDGHQSTEDELEVSWGIYRSFACIVFFYGGARIWQKVSSAFVENFNHSGESDLEYMKWFFADMIYEALFTEIDWEAITKIPIDFSQLRKKERKVRPTLSERYREEKERFFHDFVEKGGGHIQQPKESDLQSFAKEAMELIENPKIKEVLKKVTFGRYFDWLPEDIQKVLDSISRLTVRDGKMLISAKPLLENFQNSYALQVRAQENSPLPLDPTNQRIWNWIKRDPSITDTDIAQRLSISRQAVNVRRQIIISAGYPAKRRVSRQNQ